MKCTDKDCPCRAFPDEVEEIHKWKTYWDSLDDEGRRREIDMMDNYERSD